MVEPALLAERLICYAAHHLSLREDDRLYLRNLLLREFGAVAPAALPGGEEARIAGAEVPDELMAELADFAMESGRAAYRGEAERYATYVFGLLTPMPSAVGEEFRRIERELGVRAACDMFYRLCVRNGYIQKTAIGRNLRWEYEDGGNTLEITVNLSKPEKDNKDIARLLTKPKNAETKYPACMLCPENEGFAGSDSHPARGNLRTLALTLDGEPWRLQYSPYAYYPEHCIAFSCKHSPMKIDDSTVRKLLDFVERFPIYFIGSNAALPIVGGSILNHEHFQGGGHLLPMSYAPARTLLACDDEPEVRLCILDWYNSALRLESRDRAAIERIAGQIIAAWENWDDEENEIRSHTGEVRHNTLSPIASMTRDGCYRLDMILRNNRTDERYPDGIFHAHPEQHNIKKEGIGLIEAMGLFILPGRLKRQTAAIADILCGKAAVTDEQLADPAHDLHVHRDMIAALRRLLGHMPVSEAEANAAITDYINRTCRDILCCTAVFKNTERGQAGFLAFLGACGIHARRQ